MPGYSITVVRHDYRRVPIAVRDQDFYAVVCQSLDKARTLAINGCPFGDPQPPRHVEIAGVDGGIVLTIAIDPSLIPLDE